MFTREEFVIVRDFYVPHEEEQANPYATPGLSPNLHGLPPALAEAIHALRTAFADNKR